MGQNKEKCVMVFDSDLPIGIIANTSAILGVTLGKKIPHIVGEDITDAERKTHLGIVTIPIAMLKGNKELLKSMRKKLYDSEFEDLIVVDFSNVAQCCNIYSEYENKAARTPQEEYEYLGIAIYGDKKKVNKLTGSMPLLRE
ncbi:DUF2000 domain-containing protein [Sinanaerobacter sp. ZZT-01]|uniref:DUF2000 domain-containing protein n=1 Tax=Sinanaerobacter sp. ZZT-01 TaxID=3111540 RepID=UPI002D785916|nr:DUF2000 domain-containing protein [Sinanaerobacter sp. ZZT-01]WRR93670.1 DUF2000 domain-containing protein [Sinanaerobacter sp. ZZT-01]